MKKFSIVLVILLGITLLTGCDLGGRKGYTDEQLARELKRELDKDLSGAKFTFESGIYSADQKEIIRKHGLPCSVECSPFYAYDGGEMWWYYFGDPPYFEGSGMGFIFDRDGVYYSEVH